MNSREAHWIPGNKQERMPARMIAFDTESRFHDEGNISVQTFRTASAIQWRTDLKSGDACKASAFNDPNSLYTWITGFCKPGTRTVVWAHNLGHDIRISQAFRILPLLGWRLEWCNLDRNVSAMTWRSDHGTLVFADTWTWIPLPLTQIAPMAGLVKFDMPSNADTEDSWNDYCMRDTEIVYRVASALVAFIRREHLGNWQPTGAGMAYTTWRHRFMQHKVLVHNDSDAIQAEREAMHTGRAEAWRHGKLNGNLWTEVDMRNAYLTIGAECDLPRKLRSRYGSLTIPQFKSLSDRYRILCRCDVNTNQPVVSVRTGDRHLWPTGHFTTWLWDTEVEALIRYGQSVRIVDSYIYARDPILREWANWVLDILRNDHDDIGTIAATWIKHCSRALIGRISLRTSAWEVFGGNPEDVTGITRLTNPETMITQRLMHVGDRTLIETGRTESRHSLPQVTGWIMSECRVRLWDGMNAAGLENIAHVDTDSILVNRKGLVQLRAHYADDYTRLWQEKGSYSHLEMFGPRSYFRDGRRVASGIPVRAELADDGSFVGEKWSSVSADLELREALAVTTRQATWHLNRNDPRRKGSAGAGTETSAYAFDGSGVA